jgi:hypothetical protein
VIIHGALVENERPANDESPATQRGLLPWLLKGSLLVWLHDVLGGIG